MPDTTKTESAEAETLAFALLNEAGIISQLSRALMEARNKQGLSLPQFSVLNHLTRLGLSQSPLTLARAFQQPKTTMTHTLSTLEKADLIEWHPNPDDGRSKLVQITLKGRAARDQAIRDIADDLRRLIGDIGTDRIAGALPVLTDVRQRLDSYRD